MSLIFTEKSLRVCIECAPNDGWYSKMSVPTDGSWGVLDLSRNGYRYFLHREDTVETPRIVIIGGTSTPFAPAPESAWGAMAQRVHRSALSAQQLPIRLPTEWAEFHNRNFVAFFATPRNFGGYRWILELAPDSTNDVCYWSITEGDNQVVLQNFSPDYTLFRTAVANWKEAVSEIRAAFEKLPPPSDTQSLQMAVDLDETTFGAVTQHRTYSQWIENLTENQRKFIEHPVSQSIKLRGPAGTGKTLVLELKALRELYAAQDSGKKLRILFVTHSWAVAEQADAGLRAMDERGDLSGIDLLPLLQVAKAGLPPERGARGYQLLGEDSLSGKRLQLKHIDSIVQMLIEGDWLTFRTQCSEEFRRRVETAHGSSERNALIWDLMHEFSSVLSAHGILPGVNAERRYIALARTPWMMPLSNDADKRFVLDIYSKYIESLREDGILTSDQLINDFLNYLETFAWNLKRGLEGYDLIFVDELHLFTEQERLVLNYLTRSADEYPRILMALDPRQSPSEVYVDFPVAGVASAQSGTAEQLLGDVTSVELSTVHRFTPEILELIRHIHHSYPALDLGADWEMKLDSVESAAAHGAKPSVRVHRKRIDEVASVFARARELAASAGPGERVAVVVLESLELPTFVSAAREAKGPFQVIESRDDVDSLRYSKRSVVLSAAEYVGGLQFERVLLAGFPDVPQSVANLGHQRRRFLSLIYLAASRAKSLVEIHVNEEAGGIPEVLESAITKGVVEM